MLCRRSASLIEQHADVAGDGDQQLAEVLRLLGLLGDEVEPLDLGQAIDERADLLAEHLVDLGARDVGILDHVVQQGRGDGGVVELELGEDRRDFERMGEVGIAGGALLVAVRLHGVDVGAVQQRLVGAWDRSCRTRSTSSYWRIMARLARPHRAGVQAPLAGDPHIACRGRRAVAADTARPASARAATAAAAAAVRRTARSGSGFPCRAAAAPR